MTERRLTEPGRIVRLTLERSEDGLTVTMLIQPYGRASVELRFFGAQSVRFRSEHTDLLDVPHLLVEDISDRQWERLHYAVYDVENEFMSFFCREIESSYTADTSDT